MTKDKERFKEIMALSFTELGIEIGNNNRVGAENIIRYIQEKLDEFLKLL